MVCYLSKIVLLSVNLSHLRENLWPPNSIICLGLDHSPVLAFTLNPAQKPMGYIVQQWLLS
jgi:hypothetical protein